MIYNEHVQHIRSSKEYCGLSSNIQNKENATGTVHYTTKKKIPYSKGLMVGGLEWEKKSLFELICQVNKVQTQNPASMLGYTVHAAIQTS